MLVSLNDCGGFNVVTGFCYEFKNRYGQGHFPSAKIPYCLSLIVKVAHHIGSIGRERRWYLIDEIEIGRAHV
jgi:hypothetical protein